MIPEVDKPIKLIYEGENSNLKFSDPPETFKISDLFEIEDKLKSLGVTTRDNNGHFKSLNEILSEIADNWNVLNKNKDDDKLYLKIPYDAIMNCDFELAIGEQIFVDFSADANKIEGLKDFI